MATNSQQQTGQDDALSALNAAIAGLNIEKRTSSITPARAAFASVSNILTTVKVHFLSLHAAMCFPLTFD